MKKHNILTLTLLSLAALGASAQSAFDRALNTVVRNNLTARVEAARTEAEVEALKAENTLPGLEADFTHVWGSPKDAGNKWDFTVTQGFDWPGVYSARAEAIRNSQTAAQYLREASALEVRQEVRLLLLDIINNAKLLKMQKQLVERADAVAEKYRKGADQGELTRIDYNKAKLERITAHRELHSLEATQGELATQLSTLNGGLSVDTIIAALGTEYPTGALESTPELLQLLRDRDPQYAAMIASASAAQAKAKTERLSRLPSFKVGFSHETELGGSFNGFTVGISLPSWSRKHQVQAAKLEAIALQTEADMYLIKREAEIKADREGLAPLRTIIDEYEPIVKDQTNFTLLKKAFDAGEINYITYIQEVNYFTEANRYYLNALYEYNLALARLAKYN